MLPVLGSMRGEASLGRRAVVWLVTLSAIVVGTQAAHAIAYRLVYPESQLRWRELLATGHSYVAYEPLLLAVAGACAVVSLVALGVGEARGRRAPALPAWAFALLPPLVFSLQELLERALTGTGLDPAFLLQPTFRVGLLLQLPCALAVYLTARLLFGAAVRLQVWLAAAVRAVRGAPGRPSRPRGLVAPPRLAPLASGRCGRGPPLLVV